MKTTGISRWRLTVVLALGLLVLGLSACGTESPTGTPLPIVDTPTAALAPPAATPPPLAPSVTASPLAPTAPPSATPAQPASVPPTPAAPPATDTLPPATSTLPAATATPLALPSRTPSPVPPRPAATATPRPAVRAAATAEPDSCVLSVGRVQDWGLRVGSHQAGDTAKAIAGLQSPCVDDRWLALWAVGSIHDPRGVPAVHAYLAAHPAGDWRGDAYDLVPLARVTLSYLQAPQDALHTYTVDTVHLFARIPAFSDTGDPTPGPAVVLPPGTPLVRLARVPTQQTRPDHAGDTPLVFERVRRPGDVTPYYVDISPYVDALPRYFEPATPWAP